MYKCKDSRKFLELSRYYVILSLDIVALSCKNTKVSRKIVKISCYFVKLSREKGKL